MSEYINKDAIDYDFYWNTKGYSIQECQRAEQLVNEQPTADVVEVKHGKWIIREPIHMHSICSCCGFYNAIDPYYKYCPNCGADMRGGR